MTTTSWRVARVDRTLVRLVPAAPDAAALGSDVGADVDVDSDVDVDVDVDVDRAVATRTVALRPGGVLGCVVGDAVAPAVGDLAVAAPTDGDPDRVLLTPRRTALVRDTTDRTAREQVIAANVDVVLVVEHLDPEPKVGRIERLVTLARRSGARPVVVLTKADLVSDAEHWSADAAAAAPGVSIHVVSASSGLGIDDLRAQVEPGETLVVVGPSGAGKSTLVNALAGAEVMQTGERRGDGKGRHTTTHRELVALTLPGGFAWLIDTPGLRAVGLVADAESVAATFPEIDELVLECRFSNCSHEGEPGCAVAAGIADGTLAERRVASWRAQLREAEFQARRAGDRVALAAYKERFREHEKRRRAYHRATGKGRE